MRKFCAPLNPNPGSLPVLGIASRSRTPITVAGLLMANVRKSKFIFPGLATCHRWIIMWRSRSALWHKHNKCPIWHALSLNVNRPSSQQAYRCTNVPIQEIRCKWIRIYNGSKWAIYYEILTCSFWDMSTLILSQVFLKTTFRMGLGDFLLGYVIIGIFWWYIALFGTGKINYMIEITMEKVKFYTEFEIMEKKAFVSNYGKNPSNHMFRKIF